MARLTIKVIPSASRTGIDKWLGDALKVRVTAPAERGRANAAAEATLASALGVSPKSVRVVAGGTSPRKIVEIAGLSESEIHQRLATGAMQGDSPKRRRS